MAGRVYVAVGFATFLLFFAGTFLAARGIDLTGDVDVSVGTCVTKDADGRLATVRCGSRGAQLVTQVAPAGLYCDNPADIQHISLTAGRPTICVSAGR